MNSSTETLRPVGVVVAGLVAIPWKEKPLRSVLPLACRVGS